jgi:predicted MPP superfamily phosphohydrolase
MHLSRRDFLAYLGTGAAALLSGHVAGNVYHAGVTRHRLALPFLRRPVRIVQLSDLHYGPYIHEGSVRAWVAQTQAEKPDLIVITGDVVDKQLRRSLRPLVAALAGLDAPLGVWACLGNHDRARFGFGEVRELEEALTEAGVTLLVNEGRRVRDDLYLAAVDDLEMGHPNLEAALRGAPGGVATLLLCHQPDFFPEMTLPVGLTLAGHTHGGQVRLPWVGVLYTSSRYGERYLEGWVPPPDAHFGKGYVSRGLGVSLLPVRLNCPAELAVFDIAPGKRFL